MTLGNAGEMAMEDDDRPLKEECVLPPKEAGGRDGILSKLPTCESLKERAEVHQALSDPVRLRIVHLLGLSALCPCVLKDLTGLSDS